MFFFKNKKLSEISDKLDHALQLINEQQAELQTLYDKLENMENMNQSIASNIHENAETANQILIEFSASEEKHWNELADYLGNVAEQNSADLKKQEGKIKENQKDLLERIDKLDQKQTELNSNVENDVRLLLLNSVMDQMPL